MSELTDFEYFKQKQLANVDFNTGQVDVWALAACRSKQPDGSIKISCKPYIRKNVGSLNQDGYSRLWCKDTLRMKHRLLYWLYTGEIPIEIDHIDGNRNNNSISNLRNVTRQVQLQNIQKPCKNRFRFTDEILHQVCQMIVQGVNDTQIAKQVGCSRTAIMGVRTKYRHKKFSDQYF